MEPAKASPIALMTCAEVGLETMVVTSATVTIDPSTLKSLSPIGIFLPSDDQRTVFFLRYLFQGASDGVFNSAVPEVIPRILGCLVSKELRYDNSDESKHGGYRRRRLIRSGETDSQTESCANGKGRHQTGNNGF